MSAGPEVTLKELAARGINHSPINIPVQNGKGNAEAVLRKGLIQNLPTFSGKDEENPYSHLREYTLVCKAMQPAGMEEDELLIKAFYFSLREKAREWLLNRTVPIETWSELKKKFVNIFFPASKIAQVRKCIYSMQQGTMEPFDEYWNRFKTLCLTCPDHQIPESLQIMHFYEGLQHQDRENWISLVVEFSLTKQWLMQKD